MSQYTLEFPDWYDQEAAVIEAKGWFGEAMLRASGKSFQLVFYDPVRLSQEIADDVGRGQFFFEKNLVVVGALTRAKMEQAVAALVANGSLSMLVAEQP